MTMDLQQIRDSLRRHTGTDDQDLPDPVADELIARSYEELTDKYPFRETDSRLDFNTTVNPTDPNVQEYKYTFPANFVAVNTVSVLDPDVSESDGQKHKLERMTKADYEAMTNVNDWAARRPTHYVRDNDCLILWPTPDKLYRITVRYEKALGDLIDPTLAPGIPRSWHEIILLGAVWRAFLEFGDNNRAQIYKGQQADLIMTSVPVESKEEFDSTLSGVEVLGRGYRRNSRHRC